MSSQPPEPATHLTDTQRLAHDITKATTNLRRDWPHMIRPGETQTPGMASRSGVTLDDHDPRDNDQRRIDRTISLRRLAQDQLADWCTLIIEDRGTRHGTPAKTDVPAMAGFIARHSDWLSGHEAGEDCRDEIRTLARACHLTVYPKQRESMSIGRCPLEIPGEMDVLETCDGDVRVRLLPDEKPGEAYAACSRCGEVAVASWWAERMFVDGEGSPLVTSGELVAVIAYRLHIVVTHEQIRQWKHRGKIQGAGHDNKGRTLYRHEDVIDAIRADVRAKGPKVGA